jgi:RND family efflux transporter MFP subunit
MAACDSESLPDVQESEVSARPAKLLLVGHTSSSDFLNYPAVIQAQRLSRLSFEVGGTLSEVLVVEAQEVKKGEVLARLDQRDLISSRDSARAQFDNANTVYQRALRLMEEDAISRSELDQRKSQHDVSKAQLDTAEKALQDSSIIAPHAGAVSRVAVKVRQVVSSGDAAIDILDTSGLEAIINIPSSVIAAAGGRERQPESYVVLDAAPGRRIPIVFKEASLEADAASQTYEITYTFSSPDDLIILPGMNGIVWVEDLRSSGENSDSVSIPLTAIAADGDQKYVWVLDESSMTVSKRVVTIGVGVGTTVNVVNGLTPGETIVSAGVSSLSEGMKVASWSE